MATTEPGLKVTILIESEEAGLLHRLMSGSADVAVIEELVSPGPRFPASRGEPTGNGVTGAVR
jgi:hypothetical protein